MVQDDAPRNARDRATALYTFLKEFTELRTSTVRTLDQYEHILGFWDVPREPECDCVAWYRGQDREDQVIAPDLREGRADDEQDVRLQVADRRERR